MTFAKRRSPKLSASRCLIVGIRGSPSIRAAIARGEGCFSSPLSNALAQSRELMFAVANLQPANNPIGPKEELCRQHDTTEHCERPAGGTVDTLARVWRVYVVPAGVFQSLMIGGGYGTGREVVEYFSRYGFVGGLLGLVLVTACFAVLLAVSYEFARLYHVYDYRRFCRELLGEDGSHLK